MVDRDEADRGTLIIEALFHEYDALRAEIVARTSSRFQLIGLAAVAATLVTSKWAQGLDFLWITIGTVAFAGAIWIAFRLYINRCAARVAQIEVKINSLIKRPGRTSDEPVLIWESHLIPLRWVRGLLESNSTMRERWDRELQPKPKATEGSGQPGG